MRSRPNSDRTRLTTLFAVVFAVSMAGCAVPDGSEKAAGELPAAEQENKRPAPEQVQPEPIEVMFTGDMLANDQLLARARRYADGDGYDFMPMLRGMKPIISNADWAICHQETPVSPDNSAISYYPRFSAPYQLVAAEEAIGYDACSTASNHSIDYHQEGIAGTLTTLERYGIQHTGTARSKAEAREHTIYSVGQARIGHLSYTYGTNGLPLRDPWSVNLIDPQRIRADAREISQAGAEIVIVSLHWGTPLQPQPTAKQKRIADAVMKSPYIDLIVGTHAHVVQPIEKRDDGRWVIYGLGNFLAQMDVRASNPNPPHRDGVIVQVTFAPHGADWQISQVGYIPTFVDAPSDRVVLAPPFSRKRTVESLTSMGAPLVDLTPQ